MTPDEKTIIAGKQSGATSVCLVRHDALDGDAIAAWRDIAERALEANAYLTPQFVLTALRHLQPAAPALIMLIEKPAAQGGALIGVGAFTPAAASRACPLPHLTAYRSKHSYLSGMLLDRDHAINAIDAFFEFVSRPGSGWHAVDFVRCSRDSRQFQLMAEGARRRGIPWFERQRERRAVLLPQAQNPGARSSVSLIKDLSRRQRRLEEHGEVSWNLLTGKEVTGQVIDRFLTLEHSGWKGSQSSSLRSNASHEQFFRAMIDEFVARDEVFFTELCLNGSAIASTCNLISGQAGFAFKIGWDPEFARFSPGLLNELKLLQQAPDFCRHFSYIDSGAEEGSFIERLWPEHRELTSGIFATSPTGRTLASVLDTCRRAKKGIQAVSLKFRGAVEPGKSRA